MTFVKVFKSLNLFQPLKARSLAYVTINLGDLIVAVNDDGSIYGACGAVAAPLPTVEQTKVCGLLT